MDPFSPHVLLTDPYTMEIAPQPQPPYTVSMLCILSILIVYMWIVCTTKQRFPEVRIH